MQRGPPMSAYAKVNSLNIKGSKNTYLVYYYVHHVDMLFCIPMWQGRAAFCTISLSVRGLHEIATRAAVGPWAAGCRPLPYRDNGHLSRVQLCFNNKLSSILENDPLNDQKLSQ